MYVKTVVMAALACMFLAVGILGWQAIGWLKDGHWSTMPLSETLMHFGLSAPKGISWIGVQKIVDSLLDWPISLYCFGVGVAVFLYAIVLGEELERMRKHKERMQ